MHNLRYYFLFIFRIPLKITHNNLSRICIDSHQLRSNLLVVPKFGLEKKYLRKFEHVFMNASDDVEKVEKKAVVIGYFRKLGSDYLNWGGFVKEVTVI
jgi:hypothetical protein